MSLSLEVSDTIPAMPEVIYAAWMSSEGHSAMTGAAAHCSNRVGDPFEAWDGYATGRNLELVPGRRIVQSWRTADFPETAEDSLLEVVLVPLPDDTGGTQVTIRHSRLPEDGEQYRQGWIDYYFEPMKQYFARAL